MAKKKAVKKKVVPIKNWRLKDIREGDIYSILKDADLMSMGEFGALENAKYVLVTSIEPTYFYFNILDKDKCKIGSDLMSVAPRHLAKRIYTIPVKKVKYIVGGTKYFTKKEMLAKAGSGDDVFEVSKSFRIVSVNKLQEKN